ncbi:hypothetical protein ES703_91220 [subsurface metagenome]
MEPAELLRLAHVFGSDYLCCPQPELGRLELQEPPAEQVSPVELELPLPQG